MYNYITGKVVYSAGNTIVVDNNGIGYEIGASNFTTNKFTEGEIAKIYTYLYVREDTYALYGFSSIEEKTLFLRRNRRREIPFENQRFGQKNCGTYRRQHARSGFA